MKHSGNHCVASSSAANSSVWAEVAVPGLLTPQLAGEKEACPRGPYCPQGVRGQPAEDGGGRRAMEAVGSPDGQLESLAEGTHSLPVTSPEPAPLRA